MKKKEQFSIALWDRLQKDNIPHSFESRSGRKISPITKYEELHQPIVGVDLTDKDLIQWSIDGVCFKDGNKSGLDLFIVWEEEQLMLEGWLNVYNNGLFTVYTTRKEADDYAASTRIACVKVFIPYTKGEGLGDGK